VFPVGVPGVAVGAQHRVAIWLACRLVHRAPVCFGVGRRGRTDSSPFPALTVRRRRAGEPFQQARLPPQSPRKPRKYPLMG
jgi:hypothetical protein